MRSLVLRCAAFLIAICAAMPAALAQLPPRWDYTGPSGRTVTGLSVDREGTLYAVAAPTFFELVARAYRLAPDEQAWTPLDLGVEGFPTAILADTTNGLLYAGTILSFGDNPESQVVLSQDEGLTWTPFGSPIPAWITDLVVSGDTTYAATRDGIYYYDPNEDAWPLIQATAPGRLFRNLAAGPNGDLLACSSLDGLFVKPSGGAWQRDPAFSDTELSHCFVSRDGTYYVAASVLCIEINHSSHNAGTSPAPPRPSPRTAPS